MTRETEVDPLLRRSLAQREDQLDFPRLLVQLARDLDARASLVCEGVDRGREVVIAITNGKLHLGPWEHIFYYEFDGQRRKRILVKIIGE